MASASCFPAFQMKKIDNDKYMDGGVIDNLPINLAIDLGKFIAITGPNGSGKSTLVKIIMGIEKPDSGKVFLEGKDITELSIDERANLGIGFAFQQPVKFKGITVYDLLKIAAKKEMTKIEACEILSKVGLCAKEYVDREVNGSLSGGELKRIEIATVALRQAKLTIFDEPEAGIDLWSFNSLISVFEKMHSEIQNSSIVIISHQEKILNISDEIILLADGEITASGQKEDVLPLLLKQTTRPCKVMLDKGGNK